MKLCDGFLQTLATDEAHRIKRPSVRVMAEPIHRDNPRMLQTARDLRLKQEARARLHLAGITFLDLLERHFTMQLLIERHRNDAKTTLCMRPHDAKTTARRRGTANVCKGSFRVASRGANTW
jgi:hypothetical protein